MPGTEKPQIPAEKPKPITNPEQERDLSEIINFLNSKINQYGGQELFEINPSLYFSIRKAYQKLLDQHRGIYDSYSFSLGNSTGNQACLITIEVDVNQNPDSDYKASIITLLHNWIRHDLFQIYINPENERLEKIVRKSIILYFLYKFFDIVQHQKVQYLNTKVNLNTNSKMRDFLARTFKDIGLDAEIFDEDPDSEINKDLNFTVTSDQNLTQLLQSKATQYLRKALMEPNYSNMSVFEIIKTYITTSPVVEEEEDEDEDEFDN